MPKAHLLLTRPQLDSLALAKKLIQLDYDCHIDPVLVIDFINAPNLSDFLADAQVVIATSANAVRALAQQSARRDLPIYSVGPATSACATAHGFKIGLTAKGTVRDLAGRIQTKLSPKAGAIFYPVGVHHDKLLSQQLHQAGFRLHQTALYMARAKTQFSSQTIQLLQAGALHSILLFSPRSAKIFAKLFANYLENMPQSSAKDGMTIGVLSPAIAKAFIAHHPILAEYPLIMAQKPDQDALIAALEKHYAPKFG